MAKDKFLHDIGIYKCLQGNDLRFLLICIGRDMYPKNIEVELGWKKQNISNTARKLKNLGLITINAYPVYYRTNEKWVSPEIPGQLRFKVTNEK